MKRVAASLVLIAALAGCAAAPSAPRPAEIARAEAALRLDSQAQANDQWSRAAELFAEAGRLARSVDERRLDALAELNLAWLESRSSRTDAARARLVRLADASDLDPALRAEAGLRLARLEFGENRHEAARRRLDAIEGDARAALLRARLEFAAGDVDAALARVRGNAAGAGAAAQFEGRLLLAAGRPDEAAAALLRAYEHFHARGDSVMLAENLELQAEARRRLGQPERAEALLQRARALCAAWLERFAAADDWRPRDCAAP